jgi:hypothetical protein
MRMTIKGPRVRPAAIALGYALLSSGCAAQPFSSVYATVPIQFVAAAGGGYEILDRPDLGRLTITPGAGAVSHWESLTARVSAYLPLEPFSANRSHSPGSEYFEPLMSYFAQTGRTCRLIRGSPLVLPQWEFAYSCAPGFDTSVITWKAPGFSNAPIPPNVMISREAEAWRAWPVGPHK